MVLRRIPGVKHYRADPAGLREVGRSGQVASAALDAARGVAARAERLGAGRYTAEPAGVRAGWDNEYRAGAVVRESEPSLRDRKGRVLLLAASGAVYGPAPNPHVPSGSGSRSF